jgi:hypothetical protein
MKKYFKKKKKKKVVASWGTMAMEKEKGVY